MASGERDGSIRVWGAGTGAVDAALGGHSGAVGALVVAAERVTGRDDSGVGAGDEGGAADDGCVLARAQGCLMVG